MGITKQLRNISPGGEASFDLNEHKRSVIECIKTRLKDEEGLYLESSKIKGTRTLIVTRMVLSDSDKELISKAKDVPYTDHSSIMEDLAPRSESEECTACLRQIARSKELREERSSGCL